MKWKLTLRQKGLLVVAFLLGFELLLLGGFSYLLRDAQMQIDRLQDAQQVISSLQRLSTLREKATNGLLVQIQFYKDPPGSRRYYETFQKYVDAFPGELVHFKNLLKTDSVNRFRAEELDRVCRAGMAAIQEERKLYSMKDSLQERIVIARLSSVMFHAARLTDNLVDYYTKIEKDISPIEEQSRARLEQAVWAIMVLNVALAIAVGQLFVRGITRRLAVLTDNSHKLAAGVPLNPAMVGYDEIAVLDNVFHRMAGTLAESARKERAIIEHAVDVICSVDSHLAFLAVNPASETVLGYKPEEMIGKRCLDFVVAEEREATALALKNIIRERTVAQLETRLVQKDGTVIDVLWSMQWSQEEHALFCVVHDISGSKEIERMKQEFVSMVSHDLRTPLSAIQGTIELFREGMYNSSDEAGKSALHKMYLSTNRLLGLVNDLLDIEKLEAGKMVKDLKRTNIDDVIKKSIGSVAGFAEVHEVKIDYREEDIFVLADEDRLVQAVVNLLSNAIKFSRAPAVVTVETSIPDEKESQLNGAQSRYCEVRVVDTGRGISEEKAKTLFQRYSQADKGDNKRGVGTGLGLAISKAIVECHHGSIGLKSKVDEGSTFWFRVPLWSDDFQRQSGAGFKPADAPSGT
ncbi:MAG: PAS domain S-box protein [Candidatus Obscuribacterales bacterium]|nr:PAS domain S-box protein [Candidatus Obscuribacterales bacterium]